MSHLAITNFQWKTEDCSVIIFRNFFLPVFAILQLQMAISVNCAIKVVNNSSLVRSGRPQFCWRQKSLHSQHPVGWPTVASVQLASQVSRHAPLVARESVA